MKIRNILTFLLIAATTLTGESSTFAFGPGSRVEKVVAIYPGDKDCHPWTSNETYRCETANKELNFIHGQVYNWSRNTEFARLVPGYNPGTGSAVTIDKNKAYWYVDASKNVWQGGRYYGRAVNVKNHGQWIDVSLWGGHVVLYKPNSNKISSRFPASVSIPEITSIGLSLVRDELCPENTIFKDYTCTYNLDIVVGFETCPLNSAKEFYNCTNIADDTYARPTVIKEVYNAEPIYGHAAEVCPEDTRTEIYECKYINRIYDDLREKKIVALYYGESDNHCPVNTLSEQYICKYSQIRFDFMHGDTVDFINDGDRNQGELTYGKNGLRWRVEPTSLGIGWRVYTPPDNTYDIWYLQDRIVVEDARVTDNGTWTEVSFAENEIVIYKPQSSWPVDSISPISEFVQKDNREQIVKALYYGNTTNARDICPRDTSTINYICLYTARDMEKHNLAHGKIVKYSEPSYNFSHEQSLIKYFVEDISTQGFYTVNHGTWLEVFVRHVQNTASANVNLVFYLPETSWPYESVPEDNDNILALFHGDTCPEGYVCKYASSNYAQFHGKTANHIRQNFDGDASLLANRISSIEIEFAISSITTTPDTPTGSYTYDRFAASADLNTLDNPIKFGMEGTIQYNRDRWVEIVTPDGNNIIIFKDKRYWPEKYSSSGVVVVVPLPSGGEGHSIIDGIIPGKEEKLLALFYADDNNPADTCPTDTDEITYTCLFSDRLFENVHGVNNVEYTQFLPSNYLDCYYSKNQLSPYSCTPFRFLNLFNDRDGSYRTGEFLDTYTYYVTGALDEFGHNLILGWNEPIHIIDHETWIEIVIDYNDRENNIIIYKNDYFKYSNIILSY